LRDTILKSGDSLLVEVDRFVEGVDVNGGNGSAIILGYRSGVEPEILLQALGTAYGFIESARIETHAIKFEAGVHVLAEQLLGMISMGLGKRAGA